MNKQSFILTMTKGFMRIILAVVIGLAIGGASSSLIVYLNRPVLHWELTGVVIVIISAVLGGISGGLSTVVCARTEAFNRRKSLVGLCVGAGLGLGFGLWTVADSSVRAPGAPEGLTFWIIVVLVVAGSLAGLAGGSLSKTCNPE